nr:zf-TFIIB domain-containing protein [Paenibacillus dokdonensis]
MPYYCFLIDICPSCKGVWLDRGELDKLMQDVRDVRQDYNEWYYGDSPSKYGAKKEDQPSGQYYPPQQQYPDQGHSPHKKKKKSVMDMFGDLFD